MRAPRGNQICVIRGECGCPHQTLLKALSGDPRQDIVLEMGYDETGFHGLTSVTDPRGSDPAIVGGTIVRENVLEQTPRLLIGADSTLRDA